MDFKTKIELIINTNIKNISSLVSEDSCSVAYFSGCLDKMNSEVSSYLFQYFGREDYAKSILLKISNLLMAKFQYIKQHESLVCRPFGIIVDPSNSCPLRCPGCIHNDLLRKNGEVDWPSGLLDGGLYDRLLQQYGPYAIFMHFFNWGEPLLNRETPSFIRKAKGYMLATSLSSNLSVKFDAEALVLSGLDYLIMSIDGASAESYQKYRRGGNFELVLQNLQDLVNAKRKHNLTSPKLCWQFLVFEHNVHEIELAKKMAEEIGVDEINFARPYDVSWGAPEIKVYSDPPGRFSFPPQVQNDLDRVSEKLTAPLSPYVASAFSETWGEKSRAISANKQAINRNTPVKKCRWLYKNMVMDAHGRILPCCHAPRKDTQKGYVYSSLTEAPASTHFNAPLFRAARRGGWAETNGEPRKEPFCLSCAHPNMKANIDNDKIITYFEYFLGKFAVPPFLDQETIRILADWDEKGGPG